MSTSPQTKLAQLSDGQRQVLALVAQHRSTKAIARTLGISPHTVDQRVKRACHLLGVSTRAEAARAFMAAASLTMVDQTLWGKPVYELPDLADDCSLPDVKGASEWEDRLRSEAAILREAPATGFGQFVEAPQPRLWFTGLLEASRENRLTPFWRTAVMVVITFIAVGAVALVVSISEGLTRLY